ncbi:MAG: hypothetical protein KDB73_18305 [Planctomycetes bacterium]|nr:hypothetical protein [Planctomycetota bacterium]
MTLPWHLTALVSMAERLVGGPVRHDVRGEGADATVVFHLEARDAVLARRLDAALAAACDAASMPRRYFVVRTEPTTFRKGPDIPDAWPPEHVSG